MTSKERSEKSTKVRSSKARTSSAGQWLIGLLIVLALVASLLMLFGNDFSLTATLAVIAALWAAVIGAVLVTKYRRQAEVAETRGRDLRQVYELQLEREIAARRQYETDVEAAIREEVSHEANTELEELKAQVLALRASLEHLLGTPLPDVRAAIGLERPRELRAGLAGAGYTAAAADDRVVADRDFATTAPPSDSGRHLPDEPQDAETVDPVELTEIIPVVTDDPEAAHDEQDAVADDDLDVADYGAEQVAHDDAPQYPQYDRYEHAPHQQPQYTDTQYTDTQYTDDQYGGQQFPQQSQYPGPQYSEQQYSEQQYSEQQYSGQQHVGQHQYTDAQYADQPYEQPQYDAQQYDAQQYGAQQYDEQQYAEPQPEYDQTQYQSGPFERVAYGAQAYEPPAPPQPGRRAAPEPAAHPDADGAHVAGRPASELLSRLREGSAGESRGGRRRRD